MSLLSPPFMFLEFDDDLGLPVGLVSVCVVLLSASLAVEEDVDAPN